MQALGGETPGRGAAGVRGPSARGDSAVTRLTTHLRRAAQAVAPESRRAVDGRPQDLIVVSTPRSVPSGAGGRSDVVMLHDSLQNHLAAVGVRRRMGESSGWVFGWPRNRGVPRRGAVAVAVAGSRGLVDNRRGIPGRPEEDFRRGVPRCDAFAGRRLAGGKISRGVPRCPRSPFHRGVPRRQAIDWGVPGGSRRVSGSAPRLLRRGVPRSTSGSPAERAYYTA